MFQMTQQKQYSFICWYQFTIQQLSNYHAYVHIYIYIKKATFCHYKSMLFGYKIAFYTPHYQCLPKTAFNRCRLITDYLAIPSVIIFILFIITFFPYLNYLSSSKPLRIPNFLAKAWCITSSSSM